MSMFAKRQLRLLAAYLDQHGIAHRILTAEPQPRYSWPVLYVGGLKLMTVGASVTSDCTVELKINPLRALERKLEREFPGLVLATGVRLDESIARSQSIKEIGLERRSGRWRGWFPQCGPYRRLVDPEVWLLLRCMGVGRSASTAITCRTGIHLQPISAASIATRMRATVLSLGRRCSPRGVAVVGAAFAQAVRSAQSSTPINRPSR